MIRFHLSSVLSNNMDEQSGMKASIGFEMNPAKMSDLDISIDIYLSL